jgi:hypothetical protein
MTSRTVITLVTAAVMLTVTGTAAADTPTRVWDRVAQCESGGDWSINTGNGYHGGLQFTEETWREHAGTGRPEDASKDEQIAVAERVLADQGWGAWPVCSRKAGLR